MEKHYLSVLLARLIALTVAYTQAPLESLSFRFAMPT